VRALNRLPRGAARRRPGLSLQPIAVGYTRSAPRNAEGAARGTTDPSR
jgi:hypothetical protein